jgi:hypothetical protein
MIKSTPSALDAGAVAARRPTGEAQPPKTKKAITMTAPSAGHAPKKPSKKPVIKKPTGRTGRYGCPGIPGLPKTPERRKMFYDALCSKMRLLRIEKRRERGLETKVSRVDAERNPTAFGIVETKENSD